MFLLLPALLWAFEIVKSWGRQKEKDHDWSNAKLHEAHFSGTSFSILHYGLERRAKRIVQKSIFVP
jgi:hypothetical protein